jgi:hypothetical protein
MGDAWHNTTLVRSTKKHKSDFILFFNFLLKSEELTIREAISASLPESSGV